MAQVFENALGVPLAGLMSVPLVLREVLIAFLLLLTFMFIGESFLKLMNLSELSLQIGGGVILFLIALRMIFPPPKVDTAEPLGEPLVSRRGGLGSGRL